MSCSTLVMLLRDYQRDAVGASLEMAKRQPALVALPTGTGKTVVMQRCAEIMGERTGKPVLLLVHRNELAEQAKARLQDGGSWVFIEKAEQKASPFQVAQAASQRPTVVVGSVPTMQGRRLRKWQRDAFSLVLVDEAHHATAKTWTNIYEHFESTPTIGVTATAERKGLGDRFEIAYQMSLPEAIERGWLVPPAWRVVECEDWDLSALRATGGRDVTDGELARSFGEKAFADFCRTIREPLAERQGLIFTPGVGAAARAAEWLTADGVGAGFVDAETDRDARAQLVELFREQKLQGLANCGIFTEGFDAPSCDLVVIARPTKSSILYRQMLGRGLRPDAGCIAGLETPAERRAAIATSSKPSCLILEFGGVGARFADDLQSAARLLPAGRQDSATRAGASVGSEFTWDELQVEQSKIERADREEEARQLAERERRERMAQAQARTARKANYLGADDPVLRERTNRSTQRPEQLCSDRQRKLLFRLLMDRGWSRRDALSEWRKWKGWSRCQASAVISRMLNG